MALAAVALMCLLLPAASCTDCDEISLVQVKKTLTVASARSAEESRGLAQSKVESESKLPMRSPNIPGFMNGDHDFNGVSNGMDELEGPAGLRMYTENDAAKERIRHMANGDMEKGSNYHQYHYQQYPQYPPYSAGAASMQYAQYPQYGYQTGSMGTPQYGYQTGAMDAPYAAHFTSEEAHAQPISIQSAKLAQQEAALQAAEFPDKEGAKLAHDLLLKGVLDKYYKGMHNGNSKTATMPKAAPVAAQMLSTASSISSYSDTSGTALSEDQIQAAVRSALAKQSLQQQTQQAMAADASMASQHKVESKTSQEALLQKILETQQLLLNKVLAKEDAGERRSRRSKREKVERDEGAQDQPVHPVKENRKHVRKTLDPYVAALEAEKQIYAAQIQADRESLENYTASVKQAWIDRVNDKQQSTIRAIKAAKDMRNMRNKESLGDLYAAALNSDSEDD